MVKPKTSEDRPRAVSRKPGTSSGGTLFRRGIRHQARCHGNAQQADGHIHPEYPAPVEIGGDEAADGRPHQRAQKGRNGEPGQGVHQLRFGNLPQDDDASHRHHHGPAQALQGPRRNEPAERLRRPAGDGAQHEDGNGGAEHMLGPETVGTPAADRNENGETEQIGGEGQFQHDGVRAQVGGDGGKRRGDHRGVHVFHEQGGGDDQRDEAGGSWHFANL